MAESQLQVVSFKFITGYYYPAVTASCRSLLATAALISKFTRAMPVPTRVRPEKNIWVAASDGDLGRVQVRIVNS